MLPSRFRVCLGKVHFPEVKMVNFQIFVPFSSRVSCRDCFWCLGRGKWGVTVWWAVSVASVLSGTMITISSLQAVCLTWLRVGFSPLWGRGTSTLVPIVRSNDPRLTPNNSCVHMLVQSSPLDLGWDLWIASNQQNVAKVMGCYACGSEFKFLQDHLHYMAKVKGYYRYNQDLESVRFNKYKAGYQASPI